MLDKKRKGRAARTICAACEAHGHTANRCTAPAAVDYWRAAAVKFREQAAAHDARSKAEALTGADADAEYHHRAALVAREDADRAERKAADPTKRLTAKTSGAVRR